jgi:outer membrane receptor for Fe3+-dicitrate
MTTPVTPATACGSATNRAPVRPTAPPGTSASPAPSPRSPARPEVSNPLATTYRFKYANRGEGQIWCPWLVQWNALVGRDFRITDRQTIEADLNIYNLTNNGAGQQFINGNNASSATFGELQNVQLPRSAQISLRYHF